MNSFNAWQSVKVVGAGEFEGRAGVVVRPDGDGFAVQLDETESAPKVVQTFTAEELRPLGTG